MYCSRQTRSNRARLRYACVSKIIEQATILLAVFVLTCFANSFELGFDFELSITAYTQATTTATSTTKVYYTAKHMGGGKIQKSRCANNKSRTASTRRSAANKELTCWRRRTTSLDSSPHTGVAWLFETSMVPFTLKGQASMGCECRRGGFEAATVAIICRVHARNELFNL